MLVALFLCILLAVLLYYSKAFKDNSLNNLWIPSALILKFGAGIFLWFIYTDFYSDRATSDIFKYFDDAKYIFENTKNDLSLRWKILINSNSENLTVIELLNGTQHWDRSGSAAFNDNPIMIKIHLILFHISQGNFHIHTLFFSIISFLGSYYLFYFFKQESKLNEKLIFSASFLAPSLLFWTSGPLKESWLLFVLGVFLLALSNINKKISARSIFLIVIGLLGLLSLKSYIIISLLLGIAFFILSQKIDSSHWIKLMLGIHLLGIITIFFWGDKAIMLLNDKQFAFKSLIADVGAKSEIYIPTFQDFWSMVYTIPIALYNVYLHPLIPPYFNPLSTLASFEHLIYTLLLLIPFLFKRKLSLKEKRLTLFCFSFLLVAGTIIGLTTPVLGAIVRYKTPLIPFYLILLFTFTDFKKLQKLLS